MKTKILADYQICISVTFKSKTLLDLKWLVTIAGKKLVQIILIA